VKHADRLRARPTGESQPQVCYEGDAPDRTPHHLPLGKPSKYDCLVGGGLRKGRAGRVCRVSPVLHHAPWAKHTGKGGERHDLTRVTGRVRSGPSRRSREVMGFPSTEVKREMERR